MFNLMACRISSWPMGPVEGMGRLAGMVAIGGVIFSIIMLIDCLKRKPSDFVNPLTKSGEYDKLIWAGAIVGSLWIYFLGAIVYFFIVKKAKRDEGG